MKFYDVIMTSKIGAKLAQCELSNMKVNPADGRMGMNICKCIMQKFEVHQRVSLL